MKRLIVYIVAVLLMQAALGSLGSVEAESMDVKEFVKQTYIQGVPYEEANKFGPSDVEVLLGMLSDSSEEAYWSNIVITLCIIGDERVVDPVISFISEMKGQLNHSQYTAKTSAVMSLGYLINKSGSQKALNYLKSSLNTDVWAQREVGWSSPYQASTSDRDIQLSNMAILGLAISGHPEAKEALLSLQKPPKTEAEKAFQDLVGEAMEANEYIAKEGLVGYYQKKKRNLKD